MFHTCTGPSTMPAPGKLILGTNSMQKHRPGLSVALTEYPKNVKMPCRHQREAGTAVQTEGGWYKKTVTRSKEAVWSGLLFAKFPERHLLEHFSFLLLTPSLFSCSHQQLNTQPFSALPVIHYLRSLCIIHHRYLLVHITAAHASRTPARKCIKGHRDENVTHPKQRERTSSSSDGPSGTMKKNALFTKPGYIVKATVGRQTCSHMDLGASYLAPTNPNFYIDQMVSFFPEWDIKMQG